MRKIALLYLIAVILLMLAVACEENQSNVDYKGNLQNEVKDRQTKSPDKIVNTPDGQMPECTTDLDCITGGCSGTVCHKKGDNIFTTCEYRPEYGCYKQIECGCIDNKCQWDKNAEFEKCFQEKRNQGGGIY